MKYLVVTENIYIQNDEKGSHIISDALVIYRFNLRPRVQYIMLVWNATLKSSVHKAHSQCSVLAHCPQLERPVCLVNNCSIAEH